MDWTTEQQQVIDLRHQNLLVSAAAGSGKTAVLVERILSLVTDPQEPFDIDRMLVVTFTRAAAGEMKERIGKALEKRLEEDPGNTHLQKQGILLHHAQINTIDGFCTFVLQNYFHRIDLDPGYRIAEEDDLKLMRGKVLEELLEEEHAEGREEFCRFADAYGRGKNDKNLADLIVRLYDFAVSDPDPDLWLDQCLTAYAPETEEALEQSVWMQSMVEEAGRRVEGLLQGAVQLRDFVTVHPEAPQMYLPALQSDVVLLSELTGKTTYAAFHEAMAGIRFEKLGRGKQDDMDPELKEKVQKRRNDLKKQVEDLQKSFFAMIPEQILEDLEVTRPQAAELVRLTRRFSEMYAEAKRSKNCIDFSDLEHLALQILTERDENGKRHPTSAGKELAERFQEVMIDEYQDSNFLQEAILSAVSREGKGTGDRFMVGDIKQSIYGFRQARPELFLEKMNAYGPHSVPDTQEGANPLLSMPPADRRRGQRNDAMHRPRRDKNAEAFLKEGTSCAGQTVCMQMADYKQESSREEHASETAGVRIDLDKNFRSRRQVLETANALFSVLMVPELGGIVYDDAASLHPAAPYPESPDPEFPDTELLIVDKTSPEFDDDRSKAAMVEVEAHAAAARIRECLRSGKLWDADRQEFRPVQYRDCVILLRNAGTWGDTFVRVLQSEGIPAYAASGKGYFTTVEITTVLNYLRICDNPMQDIPLAAVLRSPIGGMRDEELARLRTGTPKGSLLEALQNAAEQGGSLGEKASGFLRQLESFRERVPCTPVHLLIRQILKETGYGDHAAAMPAGAQRKANLDMLAERAAAYEKNDYHGLFQFVRYVEQLTEREVDFGEVSLYGEEENIVRIMTIHKSKGLEFPIVILAGLGSPFNTTDEKSAVLLHAKLGFGMTAVYTEQRRIRSKTVIRSAVRNAVRHDMLAEELRVLYVAMTRAREKLILIGTGGGTEEPFLSGGRPSYRELVSAKSFLDWILMAADSGVPLKKSILRGSQMVQEEADQVLLTEAVLDEIRELIREGQPGEYDPVLREKLSEIGSFRYRDGLTDERPAKLTVSELKRMQSRQTAEEEQGAELFEEETVVPYVPKFMSDTPADSGGSHAGAYHIAGTDSAAGTDDVAGKDSADGTKGAAGKDIVVEKDSAAETDSVAGTDIVVEKNSAPGPEEELTGAARGTAYHHVLAVLDYGRIETISAEDDPAEWKALTESLQQQILEMLENGLLSAAEFRAVRPEDIAAFVCSPLGRRMAAADAAGTLHREQPFVLDLPAEQIRQLQKKDTGDNQTGESAQFRGKNNGDDHSGEHAQVWGKNAGDVHAGSTEEQDTVLIQGTIDAYWEEDGAYILADYKTDRIRPGEERLLAEKYRVQLEYYKLALEQITQIPVREMYIYAIATGKEILYE